MYDLTYNPEAKFRFQITAVARCATWETSPPKNVPDQPASLADLTALRAATSLLTNADRTAEERLRLASCQSLPRTTKYHPSGLVGCWRPAII
jgi:hypothetical protein